MKYYLIYTERYPEGKVVTSAQIMKEKLEPYAQVIEVEDKYTARLVRGALNQELEPVEFYHAVKQADPT